MFLDALLSHDVFTLLAGKEDGTCPFTISALSGTQFSHL